MASKGTPPSRVMFYSHSSLAISPVHRIPRKSSDLQRSRRNDLACSPAHHCARPDDQQAAQTALTLLMGASSSDKPRHLGTSMPSEMHHRTVLGCPSISPERVLYALAIDRRHQH